jgi:Uma2 family endonuclease
MAGAKPNHAEITARLTHLLIAKLDGGQCKVFSNDLRVKTKDDLYAYPDLTVVCQKPVYEKRQGLETLLNPTMLVEVSSPTTEGYDRGEKFHLYQELESLQDYLVVAQDYAGIDYYARKDDGWLIKSYAKGEVVILKNLGIELSVDEVYRGIDFPPPLPPPPDLHVVRDRRPEP